ncbi:helix-turn-helix protein [Homoserinimonas aerilata]|uniref:Helix-turn-helix protein n=1 Tax=Homoserinimonas aerilata TaxID=1162970 RepID=A0A542YGG7_9MICO|nr:helix-turn-helix transcriptional regulator [Homoserinimonas aerilata]TQL47165.1 helix-turn-helix protein [Homoserinimonas aerilata]
MTAPMTTEEWAVRLGGQIRDLRIDMQLDQSEVASRASVSRPALHSLEAGKGTSLTTLIKVLRALHSLDWLGTLHETAEDPSPMELLRREREQTKRATRVRSSMKPDEGER